MGVRIHKTKEDTERKIQKSKGAYEEQASTINRCHLGMGKGNCCLRSGSEKFLINNPHRPKINK